MNTRFFVTNIYTFESVSTSSIEEANSVIGARGWDDRDVMWSDDPPSVEDIYTAQGDREVAAYWRRSG